MLIKGAAQGRREKEQRATKMTGRNWRNLLGLGRSEERRLTVRDAIVGTTFNDSKRDHGHGVWWYHRWHFVTQPLPFWDATVGML